MKKISFLKIWTVEHNIPINNESIILLMIIETSCQLSFSGNKDPRVLFLILSTM